MTGNVLCRRTKIKNLFLTNGGGEKPEQLTMIFGQCRKNKSKRTAQPMKIQGLGGSFALLAFSLLLPQFLALFNLC